jgi:hypothetical protein
MFNIELHREWFTSNGEELMALCPFHEEKNRSFSLNVERGVFYCFGCQERGTVFHLVEHLTGLTQDQIRKTVRDTTPENLPNFKLKTLTKKELKILNEDEVEFLSSYSFFSHGLLMGKYCVDPNVENVTAYTDYLLKRGISREAAEYFQLGANRYSYLSFEAPRQKQIWLHEKIVTEFAEQGIMQPTQTREILKSLYLVNRRGSDYWFKPAILLPYQYQGEVYWLNGRHIPPYDAEIKYMGMRGIKRAHLFNEDALSDFEEIFVVEGEFNAILMWDRGCKNVVSFGSKHALTDELIERLWGKHIILYMDADKNDPEQKARTKAMEKIKRIAKSVVYFQMNENEDPADFLRDHSWSEFEDQVIPKFHYPDEPTEWQPHEIRPRLDKPIIISLAEAQAKNRELFQNLSENLPAYSGQKILCNSGVGSGKTTEAAGAVTHANIETLIAIGQHNLADEYETLLKVPSFLHLYGRTHPKVGCEHIGMANKLCNAGYSYYFKKNYCVAICSKASECIHYNQQDKARTTHTLLVTHAHIQLFDFLTNMYYANDTRRFIIVDESPELVKEIIFTEQNIKDNLSILDVTRGQMAMGMGYDECIVSFIAVFKQMEHALNRKEDYIAHMEPFHQRDVKNILKAVKPQLSTRLPRFMLPEMVYAVNNELRFEFITKGEIPLLRYTWRPKFSSQATVVFLSATTTKKYLENQLGEEVSVVVGEQFYIQRENLHVAQLVNISGGRTRLTRVVNGEMKSEGDIGYLQNLKLFLQMVLEQHKEQRILIVTSLGCNEDGAVKDKVIEALQPIAQKANRELAAVSTRDLEGNIEFLKRDVPVIHYGMLGTNLFADFEVCIELNAHYYNPSAIIEGIKTEFGIELNPKHFKKYPETFKTLEQEYTISRWGYFDPQNPEYTEMVELFLVNNQRADMMQAEGRILRGEDLPRWLYRLHNVNILPYPNAVYRSWTTLLKKEFGYVNPKSIKGNVKKALEWIEENAPEREFTVVELTKALGGYKQLNQDTLRRLAKLGLIEKVSEGGGRGLPVRWKLTKQKNVV